MAQTSDPVALGPPARVVVVYRGQPMWMALIFTFFALCSVLGLCAAAADSLRGATFHDGGGWAGLPPLLVGFALLLVMRRVWLRTRITVDAASRTVSVETSRWPLRGTTQSIPFGELARVDVSRPAGRPRGLAFRAVLVLVSGKEVPLLPRYTNGFGVHWRAAMQIRAALHQAGASAGTPG